MAKSENWSEIEIAATVADYMRMLTLELSGQKYNKTAHRQALLLKLQNRSDAAVELKHQNISAVLLDLECIWIPGYKPRANYQQALATYVENWIFNNPQFDTILQSAVEQPAVLPSAVDFSQFVVDPPRITNKVEEARNTYNIPNRVAFKRDYVAREARNAALGNAGELLVLEYEEFRLRAAGKRQLAERIEHISNTQGDGTGFDILSFELDGKERYVEVKTTAFAKETPFFASRNEVTFAQEKSNQFYLYRLFDFRKSPRLFSMQGKIDQHCTLDPVSYICRF